MRWPKEFAGPVLGVPADTEGSAFPYSAISPDRVRISIGNQMHEKEIMPEDISIDFTVHLNKGKTLLVNDLIEVEEKYGVYYTYVRRVESRP